MTAVQAGELSLLFGQVLAWQSCLSASEHTNQSPQNVGPDHHGHPPCTEVEAETETGLLPLAASSPVQPAREGINERAENEHAPHRHGPQSRVSVDSRFVKVHSGTEEI